MFSRVNLWLKTLARQALTPCGSHARAARTFALLRVLCTSAFNFHVAGIRFRINAETQRTRSKRGEEIFSSADLSISDDFALNFVIKI